MVHRFRVREEDEEYEEVHYWDILQEVKDLDCPLGMHLHTLFFTNFYNFVVTVSIVLTCIPISRGIDSVVGVESQPEVEKRLALEETPCRG